MKFEGAIFDLDGTLTDSMYIWNEAPKALVRQFGGQPPEDLAEDIKEMGRREASEYMVARFSLPCTPEQVMDGVNDLVTDEYRDRVPMKLGADVLLDRLAVLGVPCGIATASEAFQARDAMVRLGLWKHFLFAFSSPRRNTPSSLRTPSTPPGPPRRRDSWWPGCMTPRRRGIRRL